MSGSTRSSLSRRVNEITSIPNVKNVPSRNLSRRSNWPEIRNQGTRCTHLGVDHRIILTTTRRSSQYVSTTIIALGKSEEWSLPSQPKLETDRITNEKEDASRQAFWQFVILYYTCFKIWKNGRNQVYTTHRRYILKYTKSDFGGNLTRTKYKTILISMLCAKYKATQFVEDRDPI